MRHVSATCHRRTERFALMATERRHEAGARIVQQPEDIAMGLIGSIVGGLGKTIAGALVKTVALGMYDEIKESNKKTDDYGKFVDVMEKATKRNESCKPDELSRGCGMSYTMEHYYQEGMTTHGPFGNENKGMSGTSPLRIYTVVGSDGQIINAQGFDLSKTVKYTVTHKDGTQDTEDLDAAEASKRIQREAGYPDPNNRL